MSNFRTLGSVTGQGSLNYTKNTQSYIKTFEGNSVFGNKALANESQGGDSVNTKETTPATTATTTAPKTDAKTDPVPPTVITVSSKPTEGQQKHIDSQLEKARNATLGVENLEEKEHVIYEDEDGNKKEEKIIKKNDETGETVTTIIKYDSEGRPISTSVEKEKIGLTGKLTKVDGERHTFTYTEEGNVIDQKEFGYGNVKILVAISPIVIGPDGKQIHSEREKEIFGKTGFNIDSYA